jgi:rubrerythrin
VTNFCAKLFQQVANRAHKGNEDEDEEVVVQPADLEGALSELMKNKVTASADSDKAHKVPVSNSLPLATARASCPAPPPPLTVTYEVVVTAEKETEVVAETVSTVSVSPQPHLVALQTILDQRDMNTAQGVEYLSTLSAFDEEFIDLAGEIAAALGVSLNEATKKLLEWQSRQVDVREKMREQEVETQLAKEEGRQALVPIWRCGVCGRADKPYIACYVAPFIVRYQVLPVSK